MPLSHAGRWAVVATLLAGPATAADKVSYNRDIRPVLAETCFPCHGPDAAARKAKLRLDDRQAAIDKGVLAPGQVDDSELVARLFKDADDDQLMPPKNSHKSLSAEQKATLKRWVAEGAEYQSHWSFLPPIKPTPPAVTDAGWVRSPIDAFVLKELEKKGLAPAPAADKRTLARRWSLDLTGLPPKPEAVAKYLTDAAPGADERYIDTLLASPQWGEHRGRYWLDAARYADTHGIHFDNYREMWAYRDWVFQALNRNLPFDQFTREQLAGDLLPNPTLDQKVATGFVRCNITTNEGGAIDEEYLVLYARDRTETASQVWLGLTTGCAVCHDHKYDPVSQKEFYRLSAFFNNTVQRAMDGNVKDTPPTLVVPSSADRVAWDAARTELADLIRQRDARKVVAKRAFEEWVKAATPAAVLDRRPTAGLTAYLWGDEGAGGLRAVVGGSPRSFELPKDGAWGPGPQSAKAVRVRTGNPLVVPGAGDFERDEPFSYAAWVTVPQRGQTGAVFARMDEKAGHRGWDLWLDNDKFVVHLVNTWPTDAIRVATRGGIDPNQWHHVAVSYDGSGAAAGVRIYVDGEPQATDVSEDRLRSSIRVDRPLKFGQRHHGQSLKLVGIQDFRLYDRALAGPEVAGLVQAAKAADTLGKGDKRTAAEGEALFDHYLTTEDAEFHTVAVKLVATRQREAELKGRGTIAHVAAEKTTPAEAYVLFRGEYDRRKDKVAPGTPAVLPAYPAGAPANRLGLADWLLQKDHPLTARVTVNRFWQELFGVGLVRTAGDFGVSGETPSHPELLDWLATDFARDWDMKRFFKQLVLSNTYRQAAVVTPEKLEKDRDNRLLSRGPRFRMDAEMVRDYALAVSGLLVPKLGGPSVKPYQPDGVWEAVAMIGSNTRDYKQDRGDSLYRRSVYTFWKRAAPPASLDILNAPNRETCAVRRERTNTPLQALVTLNDVQFVEAARHLATTVLKAKPDTPGRLGELSERLLARPLTPHEAELTTGVLDRLVKHYAADTAGAKKLIGFGESKPDTTLPAGELAAWTMLANQLLNLDEVLNK